MVKKIEVEQPAYGQAQILDAAQQAANEATPAPPESPEAQAVRAALAGQAEDVAPPEEMPANQVQTAAPQPVQGVTVKNRFMLLPPQINFQATQGMTPVDRNYGMSLFWDLLAEEPQVDPAVRLIAQALKPTERS